MMYFWIGLAAVYLTAVVAQMICCVAAVNRPAGAGHKPQADAAAGAGPRRGAIGISGASAPSP